MLLLLHANMKAEKIPHLRTILFAGEVFPMKYLKQLADLLPNVELFNLYGPTETNVCTYYHVERELDRRSELLHKSIDIEHDVRMALMPPAPQPGQPGQQMAPPQGQPPAQANPYGQ